MTQFGSVNCITFFVCFSGISSFVFTKEGQGLYLHSPSEFTRVTLCPRFVIEPICMLELKEGMRPEPQAEALDTGIRDQYVCSYFSVGVM